MAGELRAESRVGRDPPGKSVYFNGHDTTTIITARRACGARESTLSRISVGSALALLILAAACQAGTGRAPGTATPASGAVLTHGPLAGAVTATSAAVWVRTNIAAPVQVQYSADAGMQNAVTLPASSTDPNRDFTTIVSIPNLAPRQTYYYDVLVNGATQLAAPARFQTFAARDDARPFRFVILTDFRTISKITQNVNTFAAAAREEPAFVILGGDMDHRNPTTLDEKREMFHDLYTPANGMEDFVNLVLHRFTLVHFWDDHDYGENNADKTYPEKATSLRVLEEEFPVYPLTRYGDWQAFSYGAADFFVLDSRAQRDPWREPEGPDKSMLDGDALGAAGQRAWLFDGLKNSRARWKFIVSPVIFNPTTKANDGWGAYATERAAILDFVRSNHITSVIVLSGDLHAGAIDDGRNSGLPELVAPTANDGFDKRCLTEASGNVGRWSAGSYGDASGTPCNGYAVVQVAETGVTLQVKTSDGELKLTYTVKP